jgi:hypothetical protein
MLAAADCQLDTGDIHKAIRFTHLIEHAKWKRSELKKSGSDFDTL